MQFGLFAFYLGKVLQTLFIIYAVLGSITAFEYVLVNYAEDYEWSIHSVIFFVLTAGVLQRFNKILNFITRGEEA